MKSLILTLSLTVLGACSAYKGALTAAKSTANNRHLASNADLKQLVEDLRESFRDGQIPKREDIPFGQEIGCYLHGYHYEKAPFTIRYLTGIKDTEHIAAHVDYAPNLFHFDRAKRKYIYNKGNSDYFPVSIARFTAEGIQGMFSKSFSESFKKDDIQNFIVTIRLKKGENAIIAEQAFSFDYSPVKDLVMLPESVVDEDYKVLNYMHCPL